MVFIACSLHKKPAEVLEFNITVLMMDFPGLKRKTTALQWGSIFPNYLDLSASLLDLNHSKSLLCLN